MKIASPFEGLHLPEALVCEFFAVFSRFEFTLKESGHTRENRVPLEPAWWPFAEKVDSYLAVQPGSDLANAIDYLTTDIPQVQIRKDNWEARPLHGATKVERAIDAVTRVRNNLFHGGKHTPHSPAGRDEKLIRAALSVLYACLEQNDNLRNTYEQNVF
ncbi:MAG: hypothetical protein R3F22_01565 [Lysobacteraceae bacterium]